MTSYHLCQKQFFCVVQLFTKFCLSFFPVTLYENPRSSNMKRVCCIQYIHPCSSCCMLLFCPQLSNLPGEVGSSWVHNI